MTFESFGELLAGPLALLCAVMVFTAAALDVQGETAPAAATIQMAP